MKKRLLVMLLALTMAFPLSSCGLMSRTREVMESIDEDEDDEDEVEDEDEDEEEEKSIKSKSTPVLGLEVDSDYEGFEYLYCETLMTDSQENKETGKMESQKLDVFIPKGNYVSVNRDRARVDELGVDFTVTLNPYIRYEQKNYLPDENLEYFMEEEYNPFYTTRYKAIEVSDVEETESGVMATAKYCEYDSWNDEYVPVFATYYLTELSDDVTVLVEIVISYDEVTGKTDRLLEELESFYEVEIEWSKEAAEQKLAKFLDSDEVNVNMASTGFMLFELPAGWEQDYGWDDYSVDAFAPGGDADFAECVITFDREYVGSDALDLDKELGSQEDVDSLREFFVDMLGDEAEDIAVERYGETIFGTAVRVSYTVEDLRVDTYLMWDNGYMYSIEAMQTSKSSEDLLAIVEGILESAQLR